MRFLLIPVADAVPAVRDYLAVTDDNGPGTAGEVQDMVSVAVHFALTSAALVEYVRALTGRPPAN